MEPTKQGPMSSQIVSLYNKNNSNTLLFKLMDNYAYFVLEQKIL